MKKEQINCSLEDGDLESQTSIDILSLAFQIRRFKVFIGTGGMEGYAYGSSSWWQGWSCCESACK